MTDPTAILFSRRLFLSRGVQLLSACATLPLFLNRSAECLAADFAANPHGVGRPDRVLVVVQLAGGNDGLNTVVPVTNDDYYRARPRIGIPKKQALRLDDQFAVHPAAAGFKKLWDDGHLAVVHAVGYPNPNRSHFRSTDIWATAEPEKVGKAGWLGKYCDSCCAGQDPAKIEPATAIALDQEPPEALIGDKYLPLTFQSPESLALREARNDSAVKSAFDKLNAGTTPARTGATPGDPAAMAAGGASAHTNDFLQRAALNARVYADRIKASTTAVANKATYPKSALATELSLVARMIASDLPTRVYYVKTGGFDTHSSQPDRHAKLMADLSSALAAFVADLKAFGQLDRVTTMTFSEFGRRVAENGSAGTDHGKAAPMFLLGGAIKPGFHGHAPQLAPAKLAQGDVAYTTDFRKVYATLLDRWLRADPAAVLGRKFDTMDLLKA